MLRRHTRAKLSLEDLQFVVAALCKKGEREATLLKLLGDAEMRDAMLEHPRVLECLLASRQMLAITPFLYFYLLVRAALKEFEIDDREAAEYIANLLVEFGKESRAYRVHEQATKEYHYLVDLMHDLLHADHEETFYLRSHLGNYSLFLAGLFPGRVCHRAKYHPPAPDFSYYESVGGENFRLAAQHSCAARLHLSETLELLGRRFKRVRLALNHVAENYMRIERNPAGLESVMRRVDQFIARERGKDEARFEWED